MKNEHFTLRNNILPGWRWSWTVRCRHKHTMSTGNRVLFGRMYWAEDGCSHSEALDLIEEHLIKAHGVSQEEIDKIF